MKLSDAVGRVKVAMMDVAQKASIRRLNVLRDESPCKAGCSACCSRLVYVSVAEALVMYEHLSRSGRWPEVRERARGLAAEVRDASPVAWFKMNRPCPVLGKDRLCAAYEVRPSPCSTHFVTSDPALCDPWSPKAGIYETSSMDDLHIEFMKRLDAELTGRGVLDLRLPIPVALLFAERAQSHTNLSAADIIAFIGSELA